MLKTPSNEQDISRSENKHPLIDLIVHRTFWAQSLHQLTELNVAVSHSASLQVSLSPHEYGGREWHHSLRADVESPGSILASDGNVSFIDYKL